MNAPEQNLTPAEARAALEQSERLNPVAPTDTRKLSIGLAGVGISMALVLALVRLTTAEDGAPTALRVAGFAVGMALYIVVISLFVRHINTVKASPRGFRSIYLSSFMITVVLYSVSVVTMSVASSNGQAWAWWLVVVAVIVTAAPALIGAVRISKLGRR